MSPRSKSPSIPVYNRWHDMLWCSPSFGSIRTPLLLRINHKFTTNHVNSVKNIVFVTQNLENHYKLEPRKSVIFLYFGAILQISKNVGSAKRKPGPRKKNIFLLKISPHFKRERERERERKRDWFPKRPKLFDFSSFSGMASVDLNPVSWLTFFLCVIVSFFSLYSCICICMYICVDGEKYDFGG